MVETVLIYPYFNREGSRSIFRFPPLGLGYIASYLKEHQVTADIVDCTFMDEAKAIDRVRELNPQIVGVYSMFTMRNASVRFAKNLRDDCDLLVVGGPLPTTEPELFLEHFDIVAVGEGERTMFEIVKAHRGEMELREVDGIVYKEKAGKIVKAQAEREGEIIHTRSRDPIPDLNTIPSPDRNLFDNDSYKRYYRQSRGYTTTSIMTSRGCPFNCDFCSKPVFGDTFRELSAEKIVDEVEDILSLGYDRVFFNDDCFTLTKRRVHRVCDEMVERGLDFGWECLSRVDMLDEHVAAKMRKAGCERIFFGLESGNDSVLKIMNKGAGVHQARRAVESAASAGISTGAFFILGYPGETNDTILDTIRFATSLPLDYLSFTFPYPIPGTMLYEKVRDKLIEEEPEPTGRKLVDHKLIYRSDFSEGKLEFAVLKAMSQFHMRKHLGWPSAVVEKPFEILTDALFKILK